MFSNCTRTSQAGPHRKRRIGIMFKSIQVVTNLDCEPPRKVKRLMGFLRGYLRVAIVLEDISFVFVAASCIGEVNDWLDWHSALHAADDDIVGVLAEPLESDLLEWWQ